MKDYKWVGVSGGYVDCEEKLYIINIKGKYRDSSCII